MLYTVMPLDRIYATPKNDREDKKSREKEEADLEFKEVMLPHGRAVTRRDGEDYVIEKILSTDMTDYLNDEYSPGKKVNR